MAGLYFPKEENLTPFTEEQNEALLDAVKLLKDANLPHGWQSKLDKLTFSSDKGMNVENGVMGMTSFLKSKRILIADYLAKMLTDKPSGVPNNEMTMAIIVHELTHTDQRGWLFGLAWLFLNIPGIDRLTLEKWAVENQEAAESFLSKKYQEMRKAK